MTVFGTSPEHFQSGLLGQNALGPSAWVRACEVDIVLTSIRAQTLAPDAFTGLGIDLARYHLIVVKSIQHFYAAFSPIARHVVYVNGPGTLNMDFAALPYTKRPLNYWPRAADPMSPR